MKSRFFAVIIVLCLCPSLRAANFPTDLPVLLDTLDAVLNRSAVFREQKEQRLRSLHTTLDHSTTPEARFWIYRELFNEYGPYDSDSALAMASGAIDIARTLGNRRWVEEMELNRSYVLSATGLLQQAQEALNSVEVDSLPPALRTDYYERLLFLQTHRDQFYRSQNAQGPYSRDAEQMLDSLSHVITPEDPSYYWFQGWKSMRNPEMAAEAIEPVKASLGERTFETREDALYAWVLSKLYEALGERDEQIRYLALSAIADVKASNKEIASLEELAMILYDRGDLNRANAYLNYSINCANDYRNRVRAGRLAVEQEKVIQAITLRTEEQMRRTRTALGLLAVALVILIAAIIYIAKQMSLLRQSRLELSEAKTRLEERVAELQDTRTKLHKANADLSALYTQTRQAARQLAEAKDASEQHIADVFTLCSSYINKLDDFRKNIFRMIVGRRFDDILELTKSPDLSQGEIKELYSIFDKTFLQIYPDFVEDFNKLLRPDEQITLRKGELLNTELRIYALVRLGLNDSVKIARFLHLSNQTVYNTRQRTRNKARIPREEFAEAVQKLGKNTI